MRNIERAMEWAVNVGHGTGEAAEVTFERAKKLCEFMQALDDATRFDFGPKTFVKFYEATSGKGWSK